ncbi:YvrJ family protein [Vagococcus silagei]|uniref:YvrJ family protein n=1 Tax=Vagococcus silagei TaxID=2508885 RepID=A0A4S3B565_9ENTE|nr:YvrJ family protein [Vagococcus silagei]THB60576.1 YvrJ family protein [Vagococcus silagei]
MSDILKFFNQETFAVAVSIFLLVRVESKLDDLTQAIAKLSTIIMSHQKD